MAALERRVAELEKELKAVDSLMELVMDRFTSRGVYVNCSTSGYEEIAPLGGSLVFVVACEKIEPYLEGYRVTLTFGNPYAASFTGLKGTVAFGERPTGGRSVPFSTTSVMEAGTWTTVAIAVTPAMAKDVRNINVSFTIGGAEFASRPQTGK